MKLCLTTTRRTTTAIIIINLSKASYVRFFNRLACFSWTLPDVGLVLQEEAGVVADWFKEYHMIVNPSRFHALLIKKTRRVPMARI